MLVYITKYSTLGYLNGKGNQEINFLIKLLEIFFYAAKYQEESPRLPIWSSES